MLFLLRIESIAQRAMDSIVRFHTMECAMFGISLADKIRSEVIRQRTKVLPNRISTLTSLEVRYVSVTAWLCAGHVCHDGADLCLHDGPTA